ncbi:outer membrane lipoprotein-sorting protein [Hydrogenimonas sp.]
MRIWLVSLFALSAWALDSREILEKSVGLFAGGDIAFDVESRVETGGGVQIRRFRVARLEDGPKESLLIRFVSPPTLRCTAILTVKEGEEAKSFVYFPSIGRIRAIPRSKANREAVGLGISYAELQGRGGKLLPPRERPGPDATLYEIERRQRNGARTLYLVRKDGLRLEEIRFYRKGDLIKRVVVERAGEVGGKPIVLQWRVEERRKGEVWHFRVDPASVTHRVDPAAFKKSRLKRCV